MWALLKCRTRLSLQGIPTLGHQTEIKLILYEDNSVTKVVTKRNEYCLVEIEKCCILKFFRSPSL